MVMRRKFSWARLLLALALAIAGLVYVAWPGKSTFTVSPGTTYVTAPLDKHGYVDYVTALNDRLRQGVTPQNNANVLLWQALGPSPESGTALPAEYFEWLGIAPPPVEGTYLVTWQSFLQEHAKSSNERDPSGERLSRAGKWPWKASADPELADWLKQSEKPLALILEAARRPQYYNPLVPARTEDWSPGMLMALLPTVQRCREAASALAARAMLRVAEGKPQEAWQDLLACHRLGRLVARGGTLIELLVGVAIDQVATNADIAFLDHTKLTSKEVLVCLDDLRKLPPLPAVADKIDLTERFSLLDTMMLTARQGTSFLEGFSRPSSGPPPTNLSARLFTRNTNYDAGLRNANRWLDRIVAAMRISDRTERNREIAAIIQDLKLLNQQVTDAGIIEKSFMSSDRRGEMIGNILIGLMVPAFDKVQGAADRFEQSQRNLQAAFALVAFQRDHGKYPAKLDELAGHYLAKIPGDLFSGKPLIYRPEARGFLLYSVGPNGVDDGGRGVDDEPRGDDLSVRLPVPEPPRKEPGD
jgi:hypothetical protein